MQQGKISSCDSRHAFLALPDDVRSTMSTLTRTVIKMISQFLLEINHKDLSNLISGSFFKDLVLDEKERLLSEKKA